MNVALVTGASGFVGRHAVAALAQSGFAVHGVARQPLAELPAVWHAVDLLDARARQALVESVRPSHLLHLAWETRHGYFWEAPDNLDWVAATLDLVRHFQANGGQRMVLTGSCAEYDWAPEVIADGLCREEQTPCRPATLYGEAKAATHALVAAFAARAGLSHAWGRLFFLYGPFEAEARLVPSVIRALLSGQSAEIGNGAVVRDFLHARDAGNALAALLASPVEGPVNIASGEGFAIEEIARRLGRLVGETDLLKFGTQASDRNNPARLLAEVTRLKDEVGFVPRFDLDAGLSDATEWWREHGT